MCRSCLECGEPLGDRDYRAEFCGSPCRKAFNNRRMTRGAELYDLFMAYRYQRGVAKALGLWSLICRMASVWNEADKEKGRRSWADPEKVKMRTAHYVATVVRRGTPVTRRENSEGRLS